MYSNSNYAKFPALVLASLIWQHHTDIEALDIIPLLLKDLRQHQ